MRQTAINIYPDRSTDPTYNLAWEEYLFEHLAESETVFLLWQNTPTVVIGRHQNAVAEVNQTVLEKYGISLVRRNSGGGAVYHDGGNLNYTILTADDAKRQTADAFSPFTEVVIRALKRLGVTAENGGRNDILINGRKISGNAQYRKRNRILHHGTILFDSDLMRLTEVLAVSPLKYRSAATPSVRSRVANVTEFLDTKIDVNEFKTLILDELKSTNDVSVKEIDGLALSEIARLQHEKYRSDDWTFGHSPPFGVEGIVRKFDWGLLDIRLSVRKNRIESIAFFGDFFVMEPVETLTEKFVGLPFNRSEIEKMIDAESIRAIFPELTKSELLEMLTESSLQDYV